MANKRYRQSRRSRKQRAGQTLAPESVNMGPKPFETVGEQSGLPPQQAAANALFEASSKQAAMNKALSGGSDTSRATYVVPSFSNSGTGPVNATSTSVISNKTLVEQQANSVYDDFAYKGGRRRRSYSYTKKRKTIKRRKTNKRRNRKH